MSMKMTVRSNINIPKIDFTKDLYAIAKDVVIPLIKEGILTNTDVTGMPFPSLDPRTSKRKGHSRPLQDTGTLLSSFKRKVNGKNKVLVFISSARDKIAEYLQVSGIGKAKKRFKFLAVTEGMERDANLYMQNVIKKWVRNANK